MLAGLRRWIAKVTGLYRRGGADGERAREIAAHLALLEEEFRRKGMTPEESRRHAHLRLGNPTVIREEMRRMNSVPFLEDLWRDVGYALRQLQRNPGFAVTAVLVLALGIGASVSIFAFVDAALIQPLPYKNPSRLVDVTESLALFPHGNLSYPDYADWKRMNTVFSSLDAYHATSYLFQTPNGAEPVPALRVSAGFFRTLGISPILGRDFYPGEDAVSAPATTLLSYSAWQRRFGARRDVLGQTVKLNGAPVSIIGVLPPGFAFAPGGNAEFFAALQPTTECEKRRSCHDLYGVGRLKNGVTVAAALEDMKTIARQLEKQYPDSNRGQGASVMPLAKAITGDIQPILLVLLCGAGLLLLIACVNVSNLLLVRSEKRKREMAVRGALGASWTRLMRQFVTEGLLLALAGSALGLLLANASMQALLRMISKDQMDNMPYLHGLRLTPHVWMFAGVLAVFAGALFSLVPVLRLPYRHLRDGLSDGGRGNAGNFWKRLGAHLVIAELAIAMVLLAGAGLLAKSFWRLLHVELGFNPDHVATMDIGLPMAEFGKDTQQAQFAQAALERVRNLPGVQSAAVTTVLPVSCNCNTDWVRFVGKPYNGVHNEVNDRQVSADFFRLLQARLARGRLFTEADDAHHPKVILINEAFAHKYFPGEDPIGQKLGDTELKPDSLREIVGVVANIKDGGLDEAEWPTEYEVFAQDPSTYFSLMVRTRQDAKSILPELSAAIRHLNPDVGVENETTMELRIHDSNSAWLHRSSAFLVGGFAAMALFLSIVGLYGVTAYSVSQRRREIGVRMALGAQRGSVYWLVLGEAGWLTVVGMGVGLACSIAAATLMRKVLFGVSAWDAATLTGVAVVLAAAALAASYFPARRAASVDPMQALRTE